MSKHCFLFNNNSRRYYETGADDTSYFNLKCCRCQRAVLYWTSTVADILKFELEIEIWASFLDTKPQKILITGKGKSCESSSCLKLIQSSSRCVALVCIWWNSSISVSSFHFIVFAEWGDNKMMKYVGTSWTKKWLIGKKRNMKGKN